MRDLLHDRFVRSEKILTTMMMMMMMMQHTREEKGEKEKIKCATTVKLIRRIIHGMKN